MNMNAHYFGVLPRLFVMNEEIPLSVLSMIGCKHPTTSCQHSSNVLMIEYGSLWVAVVTTSQVLSDAARIEYASDCLVKL